MSEPTPLSAKPFRADELKRLLAYGPFTDWCDPKDANRMLATIAAQATEIAALKAAQRTLDWLDEGWEFPCPSCGGGCYRSRALEKQHCYACGAAFPPEVLRVLAGKEATND